MNNRAEVHRMCTVCLMSAPLPDCVSIESDEEVKMTTTVRHVYSGVRTVLGREETGVDVLHHAADSHRRRCAQALSQGLASFALSA